jgi:hypothetical protein
MKREVAPVLILPKPGRGQYWQPRASTGYSSRKVAVTSTRIAARAGT